jgi:sulfur-oxidizing protein SoxB
MNITRRDFIQGTAIIAGSAILPPIALARKMTLENVLSFEARGNLTILHTTDTHAQLVPIHYREPATNIGVGENLAKPPHLTGRDFLAYYGIKPGTPEAFAYSSVDFLALAKEYGKMGGFAHIAALVKQIRAERTGKVLYVDTGDTLHGSAVSLWTRGQDMVQILNKLGCDAMTGHWEFTYGEERLLELIRQMQFPFLAQNVHDTNWEEPIFEPYSIKTVNGVSVAIIGQAFPYTPIANPRRFIPNWSFGIKEENMQRIVDQVRARKVDLVMVISHNGMDVDKKMAARVRGIDLIFGGHTHDGVPRPVQVGKTLIIGSGCFGKFVSRLDLEIKGKSVVDFSFKLIPVMSQAIPPDPEMEKLITGIRAPYQKKLDEVVGKTEDVLYRRGNLDGPFDELICDALQDHYGVDFVLSPGFRWGRTVLPGPITADDVYSQTALTYPNTYKNSMSGKMLKVVLEDIADNLFNPDPYRQQGGDMVRSAGLDFSIRVNEKAGSRIHDLKVGGARVEPDRQYSFAGWASMAEQSGPPVYEIVLAYIRKKKTIRIKGHSPELVL